MENIDRVLGSIGGDSGSDTVTEKPVSPADVVRGSVISHSGTKML